MAEWCGSEPGASRRHPLIERLPHTDAPPPKIGHHQYTTDPHPVPCSVPSAAHGHFRRGRPARGGVGHHRRRCPVDGGGRRRPPAAAMVGTPHARHAVLSAPVCCPNRPSARAIRGGHLRVKRRHCDPRPRPPSEGAYRAGAFQPGRGVCKCPPAQARVFARLSGSVRPRAVTCREAHLRSCGLVVRAAAAATRPREDRNGHERTAHKVGAF